ncbi:MAG TPA: TetR family transcriptional regulator [Amycolatopsis sp.]|nr:TetR family transcriptional regulator [Amycolatopsis sp.]
MTEPTPRRAPRPGERQRDAERTKSRILEAAKAEFGDKGFAAARVGEIAARAGVNKQLISYYFGGKEGLYQELTSAMTQEYQAAADPGRPLAEVVREFAMAGQYDRELARLFLWENLTDDGFGAEKQREFLLKQVDYIRARQDAGDFPADIDPGAFMLMLMAAASASFAFPRVARALTGQDPASMEFAENYADQLARIIAHLKA